MLCFISVHTRQTIQNPDTGSICIAFYALLLESVITCVVHHARTAGMPFEHSTVYLGLVTVIAVFNKKVTLYRAALSHKRDG